MGIYVSKYCSVSFKFHLSNIKSNALLQHYVLWGIRLVLTSSFLPLVILSIYNYQISNKNGQHKLFVLTKSDTFPEKITYTLSDLRFAI